MLPYNLRPKNSSLIPHPHVSAAVGRSWCLLVVCSFDLGLCQVLPETLTLNYQCHKRSTGGRGVYFLFISKGGEHQEQCSYISVEEDTSCLVHCVAASTVVLCLISQP